MAFFNTECIVAVWLLFSVSVTLIPLMLQYGIFGVVFFNANKVLFCLKMLLEHIDWMSNICNCFYS